MRKATIVIAALLLGLALGAMPAPLRAQAGEGQERMGLRQRINDLYLLRLTRALELTEQQAARIYPLLTRAEKDKAEVQRRMGVDLRRLRAELGRTPPGEKALLELASRIRQDRRAIRQKDDDVDAALEDLMTPVQKARYLLFKVEFLRNVGENLGRARGTRAQIKRTP